MTRSAVKPSIAAVKELMMQEPEGLREIVRSVMQAMLEAELDEAVGAGKGERSLRRRFRAEAGMTWETYRQRGRLLSDTARPIAQIAARCGFESPSAFAKAFRAALGETPRECRLRAGQG